MGFLGLCEGDPVIATLREVFGQNILKVPEERYKPLTVLAQRDDAISFRGALAPLLVGPPVSFDPPNQSRVADVSGKRTRSVDLELGLKILDGLLGGFGVPSAGIGAKFGEAEKVSYTFQEVYRHWVDINSVGHTLEGKRVDKKNPAAAIFFGDDAYRFLVIDSVLTSSSFTISVEEAASSGFQLDVPAIQQIVANVNPKITVSSSTGLDLTFKGETQLAFSFSCVRFEFDSDGTIRALPPAARAWFEESPGFERVGPVLDPRWVRLSPSPAMIEIRE